MKKIIVLVGIKGAGQKEFAPTAVSENIRDAVEAYAGNDVTSPLYVIDPDGSRRKRRTLYNTAKGLNKNIQVDAVFFSKLLAESDATKGDYLALQVPRIGVDCDTLQVEGKSFFKFPVTDYDLRSVMAAAADGLRAELSRIHEGHDNPHHLESIAQHIGMTIHLAPDNLKEVALFHDLGKSVAKTYYPEKGHSSYKGHANVSAQYYLNYLAHHGGLTKTGLMQLEVIHQHMAAHDGISLRNAKSNRLEGHVLHLIDNFLSVDSRAKVI